MASLQRSRYGVFHLSFRYAGSRFLRSLETSDEIEARDEKALVERSLRHLKTGVLKLEGDVSADELWQFLRSGGQTINLSSVRPSVTLDELSRQYLEGYGDGAKEASTLETEGHHLNHLKRILGPRRRVDQIGPAEVRKYVKTRQSEDGIRGRKIRPVTIGKELQTLRQLFEFARVEDYVSGKNPADSIPKPRGNQKPPFMTWEQIESKIARGGLQEADFAELWDCLFLRENEIGAFLKHVKKASESYPRFPYIYPAIAFCAYTGVRRSEMFRSEIDDVFDRVLVREKKKSKDRLITFREVPLHPSLKTILDDWLSAHPGGQYLFCKANRNALEDRTSREAFTAVTKGSKWEVLRGYHVLRHSFASNLARRGVDQRIIDEFLGHQTEEMRRRYRHLFPEDATAAINVLNFS